jgi:hypothetical protein
MISLDLMNKPFPDVLVALLLDGKISFMTGIVPFDSHALRGMRMFHEPKVDVFLNNSVNSSLKDGM